MPQQINRMCPRRERERGGEGGRKGERERERENARAQGWRLLIGTVLCVAPPCVVLSSCNQKHLTSHLLFVLNHNSARFMMMLTAFHDDADGVS